MVMNLMSIRERKTLSDGRSSALFLAVRAESQLGSVFYEQDEIFVFLRIAHCVIVEVFLRDSGGSN